MTLKVVVTMSASEETVLSEHVFDKTPIQIGRTVGNDIVLPDVEKRVSGKHARVDRAAGGYQVVDLGSTNGTYLNERKIEPQVGVDLKEGDCLAIGLFQLKLSMAEEEAAPDQTIVAVDAPRRSARLAEELPILYARSLGKPAEERRKTMREAIRSALDSVGPQDRRTILAQLQERFRPGLDGDEAAGGTGARRRDEAIQKQEALREAGTKVLQDLSARFLGEGGFETPEQVELFGALVGQSMELTLEWISKSLKGRGEFESQFSADLTMIFSKESNPIKKGGDAREIGKFLLDWRGKRSTSAIRNSLDGAFKDLTMHQIGLLAGVQESLSAVLRRLDPKAVETEVKEKGGGMFSSLPKRAWERYTEVFQEIFAENSRLFNEMIYPNVRKGYLQIHSEPEKDAAPGASS